MMFVVLENGSLPSTARQQHGDLVFLIMCSRDDSSETLLLLVSEPRAQYSQCDQVPIVVLHSLPNWVAFLFTTLEKDHFRVLFLPCQTHTIDLPQHGCLSGRKRLRRIDHGDRPHLGQPLRSARHEAWQRSRRHTSTCLRNVLPSLRARASQQPEVQRF